MARSIKASSLAVILLGLFITAPAFGQGKISGRVTDGSGNPLPGVNILIIESQRGTSTDASGNYVLINMRPDTYDLRFSFIGFGTKIVEGIQVVSGRTTQVDVTLQPQTLQTEAVTVTAERPLVRKDLTSSRVTVTAEELEALPVESFLGVISAQAGVNKGPSGTLHVRGGRSNEIAYVVDGLSVSNPFNTNGLATGVATAAIQEVTLISGAFNAEYGHAMSGIVSIVTKEGGPEYEATFSGYGGGAATTHRNIFRTPSDVLLNEYTLSGALSGPIPLTDNFFFFASGRRDVDGGYIFGRNLHAPTDSANFTQEPFYYEIQGDPYWEYHPDSQKALPDERISMNWSRGYNVFTKLTYRPTPRIKLNYDFLADGSTRKPFGATAFNYLLNPNGTYTNRTWSYNHSLHWTHLLNDNFYYEIKASLAHNAFRQYVYEDPTDPRYVLDAGDIGEGQAIGLPGYNFFFSGNQKGHVYEDARSYRVSLDATRQFGTTHEVQSGVSLQLHRLNRENFTVLYDGNQYLEPTVPPIGSPSHDKYGCKDYILDILTEEEQEGNVKPECEPQRVLQFTAYAQDKIEFDNFIINAGLRYEYFDPNGEYIPNLLDPLAGLAEADPTHMLLPRLGVSFPITSRGIIHFSYGHFAQMPPLRDMYRNPEFEFPVGAGAPLFGNTNLNPERTVQYEVGLQQQIGDHLAFDITGFYKDVRGYLARQTIRYGSLAEAEYVIFRNKDYANIKGLTFSLERRRPRNGWLSARLAYTYQMAEGSVTDASTLFYNYLSGRESEFIIVPLGFDQTHVLSTTVSISNSDAWGMSFIGRLTSGYPYSPLLIDQNLDLDPNSARKPTLINLDVHLYRNFSFGGFRIQPFLKIYNLLDRLNMHYVFDGTGSALYSLSRQQNLHAAWRDYYGLPGIPTLEDYETRPHWFSAPRQVLAGVTLSF